MHESGSGSGSVPKGSKEAATAPQPTTAMCEGDVLLPEGPAGGGQQGGEAAWGMDVDEGVVGGAASAPTSAPAAASIPAPAWAATHTPDAATAEAVAAAAAAAAAPVRLAPLRAGSSGDAEASVAVDDVVSRKQQQAWDALTTLVSAAGQCDVAGLALDTLDTLLTNILRHPAEDKYKQVPCHTGHTTGPHTDHTTLMQVPCHTDHTD